jgi:hypothetical protein
VCLWSVGFCEHLGEVPVITGEGRAKVWQVLGCGTGSWGTVWDPSVGVLILFLSIWEAFFKKKKTLLFIIINSREGSKTRVDP